MKIRRAILFMMVVIAATTSCSNRNVQNNDMIPLIAGDAEGSTYAYYNQSELSILKADETGEYNAVWTFNDTNLKQLVYLSPNTYVGITADHDVRIYDLDKGELTGVIEEEVGNQYIVKTLNALQNAEEVKCIELGTDSYVTPVCVIQSANGNSLADESSVSDTAAANFAEIAPDYENVRYVGDDMWIGWHENGKAEMIGVSDYEQKKFQSIETWDEIVDVITHNESIVALQSDGSLMRANGAPVCVDEWTGVIQLIATPNWLLAISDDGKLYTYDWNTGDNSVQEYELETLQNYFAIFNQ